jgi:uncharacterized protein YbjT (DUF2867 family)
MYLVTGATGNVGAEVVGALVAAGVGVRALSRDPSRTDRPDRPDLPDGATAVAGDLNRPDTLAGPLDGITGAFLLPGYADMPGVLAAVARAGVDRVVLLSGSSVLATDTDNAISRYMIESERAVRESGVPWTIVRPGAFMSNSLQWAPQVRAGEVLRAPFGDVRAANIDPYDIGAVAAAALLSGEHEGNAYALTGPESLLPADRARILGRVLGREVPFEAQSNDEARAEMSAAMPVEYVEAFFSFYVDGTLDESNVLPTVEEILGRPPRTFEQWATAHADAFR